MLLIIKENPKDRISEINKLLGVEHSANMQSKLSSKA